MLSTTVVAIPRLDGNFGSPKVDVMYLYTEGGKDVLGGISDAQMQTTLAAAIASANEAMTNSDIDLTLSLVYTGSVRRIRFGLDLA